MDDTKNKRKTTGVKKIAVKKDPLYVRYKCMRQRCENPKNKDYGFYGSRGISVCDEWKGIGGARRFITWAYKNGYEEGLTLDRKDNDGDYSPDNCRWITIEEQQQNRRGITRCVYDGQLMSISKIARTEDLPYAKMKRIIEKLHVPMETIK